jgi:hypothetical protein
MLICIVLVTVASFILYKSAVDLQSWCVQDTVVNLEIRIVRMCMWAELPYSVMAVKSGFSCWQRKNFIFSATSCPAVEITHSIVYNDYGVQADHQLNQVPRWKWLILRTWREIWILAEQYKWKYNSHFCTDPHYQISSKLIQWFARENSERRPDLTPLLHVNYLWLINVKCYVW